MVHASEATASWTATCHRLAGEARALAVIWEQLATQDLAWGDPKRASAHQEYATAARHRATMFEAVKRG